MSNNAKKITVVLFLTMIIWTWAYLALEQVTGVHGTIKISSENRPDLFVSFDREHPQPLEMSIKGPASKIADFKKLLEADETDQDKERLEFYFDAEKEGLDAPGPHSLNVLRFLKSDNKLRKYGLAVESCDVETINVTVEKLVMAEGLSVQCLDENGAALEPLSVEPDTVSMYVRQGWGPELLKAKVTLTKQQIEQARKGPIPKKPYVELAPGSRRLYRENVEIKLPPIEELLRDRPLQPKTIGFVVSQNQSFQNNYKPELLNEKDIRSVTKVKATDEAWSAYYNKTHYQVLIEIWDGDEKETEITREVIYNFPIEHVRQNEIKLLEAPRVAKFKLIPVSQETSQP